MNTLYILSRFSALEIEDERVYGYKVKGVEGKRRKGAKRNGIRVDAYGSRMVTFSFLSYFSIAG